MLYSLRYRLLLTLIGVMLVTIGTVALFASQVTSHELQRYVELDLERNQKIVHTLLSYSPGPAGDPQALARELAQTVDERVILADGSGQVHADSARQLVGQSLSCDEAIPAVVVTVGEPFCGQRVEKDMLNFTSAVSPPGEKPADILFFGVATAAERAALPIGPIKALDQGKILMVQRTQGQELDPIQAGFLRAVNSALVWSAIAAGLAALLLTLLLSRRILKPIDALTSAARVLGQGDLSRRVGISSNDEIGELARAFNAMADSLARQEQLRRGMVTDVAHELRTPLTNIRGYLEAMRDGMAQPSAGLLDSLHEEALLLNRLVDDLQDLALAEAGQLRLVRSEVSITDLAAQAVNAVQPAADAKAIQVTTELPDGLPAIDADPERIVQVLRNLLGNALIHTPPGGLIHIEAEYQAACLERNSTHGAAQPAILVRVSDTGCGIAPEHLPNIFERFYRADRARSRATGGAGLGLAIVRQLVEAHGGRVWAESQPGAGARFTFSVPTGAPKSQDTFTTS